MAAAGAPGRPERMRWRRRLLSLVLDLAPSHQMNTPTPTIMISAASDRSSSVPRPLPLSPARLPVTVVSVAAVLVPRPSSGPNAEPGACCWGSVWTFGAAVVAVGPAATAAGASTAASARVRAERMARRTTDRVAHRCETLGPDGPEVARKDTLGPR